MDRSARMARIGSSVRPGRIRIDRAAIAEQRVHAEQPGQRGIAMVEPEETDQTSSRRSTFSALSGSIPAPRSQREHLGPAHAQQVGEPRRRTEVGAQRPDLWARAIGMSPV